MALNAYCGLMGSGKSYEVVSQVIVRAVAAGRRVVTNVDGIDGELIRKYCIDVLHCPESHLGSVVHVTANDINFGTGALKLAKSGSKVVPVLSVPFFPSFDSSGDLLPGLVASGDLVAIDEAWRFWGINCKIADSHMSFFLEHRHFVHESTHLACEIVVMIQDISSLHRSIRSVVAFTFRTHKKVSLGLNSVYSVQMYEGAKLVKQALNGTFVRKYDPAIFPLYSSFKGGVSGQQVLSDKRGNIFSGSAIWLYMGAFVIAMCLSSWWVYRYFNKPRIIGGSGTAQVVGPAGQLKPASSPVPDVSPSWRYAGSVRRGDSVLAVMVGAGGLVRPESPSVFQGSGLVVAGLVDGVRVTTYSGPLPLAGGSPPATVITDTSLPGNAAGRGGHL